MQLIEGKKSSEDLFHQPVVKTATCAEGKKSSFAVKNYVKLFTLSFEF